MFICLHIYIFNYKGKKTKHVKFIKNSLEFNKALLRILLLILILIIIFASYFLSYGVFSCFILLLLGLIYLKVVDLKQLFLRETELEKRVHVMKESISKTFIEENPKNIQGNFIRINSILDCDKNELCNILNDYSIYNLIDNEIIKADEDLSSNKVNDLSEQGLITKYYCISLKDKGGLLSKINKVQKQSII